MKTNDNEIIEKVKKTVASTFRMASADLNPETALDSLPGWDSLGHITLMMELEREFGIRIPTDKINEPKTVGDLISLVTQVVAASV